MNDNPKTYLEGLPDGKENRPTLIETKQMGTDVISVYKRIQKASKAGKGIRLSWEDASAIMCDGAVRQAIDTADYEDSRSSSEREG